jgi:hypothetical protein
VRLALVAEDCVGAPVFGEEIDDELTAGRVLWMMGLTIEDFGVEGGVGLPIHRLTLQCIQIVLRFSKMSSQNSTFLSSFDIP